jgi:hypothetical protein
MSKIKNWKWCAFALLLTVFFGVPFVGGIIDNTDYTILERLQVSANILGLLAFWGLGLQKRVFQQLLWRLFFFIDASIFVLGMIFGKKYDVPLLWCVIFYLVLAAVTVPYYIGMFIYAFRSKQIWEETGQNSSPPYLDYPHFKWVRRKKWLRKRLGSLKWFATAAVIILCLTFIPLIIRNNRVLYPQGDPPECHEHMLKYRRTTIPELQEFERLFPNYLCDLDFSESYFVIDPNGTGQNIAYLEPNSPVTWRLSAGLHKRYLLIMEIKLVFGKIDPQTREVLSPGSHEEPTFSLWEISSVSAPLVLFEQRYVSTSRTEIETFGVNEWRRLVEAQGDFTVLDIQLNQHATTANFKLAFRNNR